MLSDAAGVEVEGPGVFKTNTVLFVAVGALAVVIQTLDVNMVPFDSAVFGRQGGRDLMSELDWVGIIDRVLFFAAIVDGLGGRKLVTKPDWGDAVGLKPPVTTIVGKGPSLPVEI